LKVSGYSHENLPIDPEQSAQRARQRGERVSAASASDAIQSALMKNIGLTVTACSMRDGSGNGMDFEVPVHRALTQSDVERLNPKREPRRSEPVVPQKNAPWIEEWMAAKKA
jgi:hypothetical protein